MTNPQSDSFLSDIQHRPLTISGISPKIRPDKLFIGNGQNALEVVVACAVKKCSESDVLAAWKKRRDGRASPVLLVVLCDEKNAWLCGPTGESPPAYANINPGQSERICRESLTLPNRHAALQFLEQALGSLDTELPGIRNHGLLSTHALLKVREHSDVGRDWKQSAQSGKRAANMSGMDLLKALNYDVKKLDNLTSLLQVSGHRTALAVLLNPDESPESSVDRFNNFSPIAYALERADKEGLNWVVLVQGSRIRLYATDEDTGVGRQGRTQTFVECQSSLLDDDQTAYLWLLFSSDALRQGGTLTHILDESIRYAGDLAKRLRNRIYEEVIPNLASGLTEAQNLNNPDKETLRLTYEMAMVILFRLLFIAYAEDRDLLPYRYNEAYRRRSLKQKAQELAENLKSEKPIAEGNNHWQEARHLWLAVNEGNSEWGVPAYNGGLFSSDPKISIAGAKLDRISLPNNCFEKALHGLLLIETDEGDPGPVDFRSLGVREFGTIYEGLLESELSAAQNDLALVQRKGEEVYEPAGDREVAVRKGEVYLHNRSGARKASGSYYTKTFAVDYLLEKSLVPALQDHLKRLDELNENDAAKAFFDFRVADIAMGSGHFLIAAVDKIEKHLSEYLGKHPLPGVSRELEKLRDAAFSQLGELADSVQIDDGRLIRRLIARRCIYGVDLNLLGVQLARLSVWIHTFVPGLPLSLLDYNLVLGNSLVGIGTVNEIKQKFEERNQETEGDIFNIDIEQKLAQAAEPLRKLAMQTETSIEDIHRHREQVEQASEPVREIEALCEVLIAQRLNPYIQPTYESWNLETRRISDSDHHQTALEELEGLNPLNFPIVFPEVFMRDRAGFDVIVGNPPWEETTVEELAFWARHYPGVRGLPSQRERKTRIEELRKERPDLVQEYDQETEQMDKLRRILMQGNYPGMGTGDPDLYKAFCWRFWQLTANDGGNIGVVLPRAALAGKGSARFRQNLLDKVTADVTTLVNNRQWVFPEVHPQYSIGLVSFQKHPDKKPIIHLHGPYADMESFLEGSSTSSKLHPDEVRQWSDGAILPLLPTPESVEILRQMSCSPRLDLNDGTTWRARPDRELDATNDRFLMNLKSKTCPKNYWPVLKGESFNLWQPDAGVHYAFSDPEIVIERLFDKRKRASGNQRSAHSEFPLKYVKQENTLPCFAPRIAFRDIARATDKRTLIACLLPAEVFLTNKAPYLLWPRGNQKDQAFLLGILCSIPFDWYARRFIELNVNFHLLNPFPVPRPARSNPLWKRTVALAGRLACPDERFSGWAKAVSVEYGPLTDNKKNGMIYELDALVAHLYELTEEQLIHCFETFHRGWDYQARLDAVLKYYHRYAKNKFGER